MLEKARSEHDDIEFLLATLPIEWPLDGRRFDAAVCAFDSINYFVVDGELQRLFQLVATALRPSGVFVFDVNSRHKLEDVFGSSHYGDDYGDFAYVWRNRTSGDEHRTTFLITLFVQDGTRFVRHEERHVQRWYSQDAIRLAAEGADLEVVSITDDYGLGACADTSLRESWVLRKVEDSVSP
jgi:SAM-dependent methyltransferase